MTEVLKALQDLNVGWKRIGHYNMKCRWSPGVACLEKGMGSSNSMNSNQYFEDDSSIIENDGITKFPDLVKFEVQVLFLL